VKSVKSDNMKHIIIGTGTIGKATGELLEAHNQSVAYNDKNADLMVNLKDKGKHVEMHVRNSYDLYWICTAEWHVDDVLNTLKDKTRNVIIRSTIKPHEFDLYQKKYPKLRLAHIPEFLRQKTAIDDIFKARHFVVGVVNTSLKETLSSFFDSLGLRYTTCSPQESSLIKLIANNWLALQISFWNEMKNICEYYECNSQLVSNTVTKDSRISEYGSNMLGSPFSGFCFPKDTKSLKKVFKEANINENIITALIETNENIA